MSQSGNLAKLEFGKLLAWINQNQLSGTLRITQDGKSKYLILEKGEITSSYSEFPEDSFRSVIRRMHLLPDARQFDLDLEEGISDSQFARILIEKGYLTEREFLDVLKRQNQDIILSLFEWRQGEFTFYQDKFPENKPITLKISSKWVFEKGLDRVRLRREIDLKLPQNALFAFKDDAARESEISSTPDKNMQICVVCMDEPLSLRDLVEKSGLTEFDTAQVLSALVQRNLIEVIQAQSTQLSDDVRKILADVEILYSKKRYWDAWMKMKKIIKDYPGVAQVQTAYRYYTEKFREDLRATIKSTDQIPQITAQLDETIYQKFPRDTAIGFLLSRIDGKSSIKDLSVLLNIDKEKLLITIYLMLKANIVSLTPRQEVDVEELQKKRRHIRQLFEKMHQQSYFEMLGIPSDADETAIKNAYFKFAKQYHPDARSDADPPDINEKMDDIFVKIRDAYQTLMDPEKRKAYEIQIGIDKSEKKAEVVRMKTKAQLQFSVGLRSLQSREYRTAMEYFRSAIDLDPYEPRYYAKLAEVCAKNPRWYRAGILACHKAIQLDPGNPTYYSILGSLQKLDGNFVEAEQQFIKVLQLDSENLTARQELASMGKSVPKEFPGPRKDTQHTPMLRNDKKEEK